MNKVVYKVQMPLPRESAEYDLSIGFVPLHVAKQGEETTYMWFEKFVEQRSTRTVEFTCVGTGWNGIPDDYWHVGTVLDGEFVWHYYARFIGE